MPILFLAADGAILGENSAAYPAPPDFVERLRANPPSDVARIEDVPPLTAEWWHWPEGEPAPVLKPTLGVVIDREEIAAGEDDAALLTGVPEGATVIIAGPHQGSFVADGTAIALSVAEPGEHEIRVTAPGRRPERFRLLAVDQGAPARRRKRSEPGQEVVIGRPAAERAEEAEGDVDAHFDALTAPLAAAVAMEGEARAHLDGSPSDRLVRLAAAEGEAPEALAAAIIARADQFWQRQEERAQARRLVREAGSRRTRPAELAKLLADRGIATRRPPSPFTL